MKKYEQEQLAYVIPIVGATFYMTFFGDEISWSENALRALNSLLTATLFGCGIVFTIQGNNHPLKNEVVINWGSLRLKLGTLCRMIAYGFYLISIFSLNTIFPTWPHMVATGYTVVVLAFLASTWYKTWSSPWWLFTPGFLASGLGLAIAFIFRIYDVKYPEFALMALGLIFIYFLNRKP